MINQYLVRLSLAAFAALILLIMELINALIFLIGMLFHSSNMPFSTGPEWYNWQSISSLYLTAVKLPNITVIKKTRLFKYI